MCGLCGIATNAIDETDIDDFRSLFFMSSLRGLDSSGSFWVYQQKDKDALTVEYRKSMMDSISFMYKHNPWKGMLDDKISGKIIAGHCRAATIGEVNQVNAHPFHIKNVVGMHNGTIKSMPVKHQKTDSERLMGLLADKGIHGMMEDLDSDDAMALVWFDRNDQSLNFYRNYHRPLMMCYLKEYDTLAWASEKTFLLLMLRRAGYKFADKDITDLPLQTLVKYVPQADEKGKLIYDWANPTKEDVKAPRFFRQGQVTTTGGTGTTGSTTETKTTETGPSRFKPNPGYHSNILPLLTRQQASNPSFKQLSFPKGGVRGFIRKEEPNNRLSFLKYTINDVGYSEFEAEHKLAQGCLWDHRKPILADFEKTLWLNQDEFLCDCCIKQKALVKRIIKGRNAA